MLKYISKLRDAGVIFHLITFEQQQYALSAPETISEKEKLAKLGIKWYPRQFKTGRFLLLKKGLNFLSAFWLILRLKVRHRPKLILAFANVAASMAYICSVTLRIPLCIFSFEPHSDFLAELGQWKKSGWKYRIMNALEWRAGKRAAYVLTGTRYMVERLKELGAHGQILRQPTGIDEEQFQFSESSRKTIREKLQIGDRPVLIYTGKFGDLYIKEEMAVLCGTLLQCQSNFFFVFLTGHPEEELLGWMKKYGVDSEHVYIGRVPYEEVPAWLSAADVGVVGIAGFPSRKYCSPTKVGEYLLCGLPYIVQENTSEDDVVAKQWNVGAVIRSFAANDVSEAWPTLNKLLAEDKMVVRKRCRNAGIEYRSSASVVQTLRSVLESEILP